MILSAIGIFMVVDSHTFIAFDLFGNVIPYNSFFMPMFVFISGYFNKVDSSTRLLPYTWKKIRTLIFPYIGISVAVLGLQWVLNLIKLGESVPPPQGFFMYVLENVVTTGVPFMMVLPMWFVISLFSVLLVYAVLKKFLFRIWKSYIMLPVFIALHLFAVYAGMYADRDALNPLLLPFKIMFFLPFLELGIIYREHLEKKHTGLSGGYKIGIMALLLLFNMARTMYLPQPYDVAFDSIDDLSGFTSPFIVTPMISSLVGILFWLTLVDLIGKPVQESRFVNFMSCNTFWIMGFHIAFFNVLNCILLLISENVVTLRYFDAEYFRESEWYYWEISPYFKIAYVIFGILGPLGVKWVFDKIIIAVSKALPSKKAA